MQDTEHMILLKQNITSKDSHNFEINIMFLT